jgi:hypothetical protein
MPAGGYVITSDDIKNLAKVLRKVSPQLGKDMRRAVRTAAKPVLTDMKSTIGGNAMTAYGGGPHAYDGPTGAGGITAKMQRNIRLRISGGKVRIFVPAAGSIGRIAASIDAGKAWRHPVMSNRKAWVSQTGSASGWFTDTAHQHFPQISRDVKDVLDEFAAKVAAMI